MIIASSQAVPRDLSHEGKYSERDSHALKGEKQVNGASNEKELTSYSSHWNDKLNPRLLPLPLDRWKTRPPLPRCVSLKAVLIDSLPSWIDLFIHTLLQESNKVTFHGLHFADNILIHFRRMPAGHNSSYKTAARACIVSNAGWKRIVFKCP